MTASCRRIAWPRLCAIVLPLLVAPDCMLIADFHDLTGGAGEVPSEGGADAARDAEMGDGPTPRDAPHSDKYRDAVLEDQPLGYWRLGETAGSVAKDEMGKHDGTYVGTVGRGVPGAILGSNDTAAVFGNGSVTVGDVFDFPGKSSFTLEAWIFHDRPFPDGGDSEQYFVDKEGTEGGYHVFLGRPMTLNLDRSVGPYDFDTANVQSFVQGPTFRHVVATFDGSRCRLHIDGVEATNTTCTRSLADNSASFTIGSAFSRGRFDGVVDEVAVYGVALPASRIQAHFNAARTP